ncbi:hypothetical protein CBM2589_A90963 [Cupriavidus taiwanensis]|uniref:Uncharacterized protein n=1 Tax=Cupriavidus taiwanensis TaxID=164546 RepID=A0A975XH21_9BURK|nr:hypothetical protein CBM2589_A90963 [Cupriavidus taiwanensis]
MQGGRAGGRPGRGRYGVPAGAARTQKRVRSGNAVLRHRAPPGCDGLYQWEVATYAGRRRHAGHAYRACLAMAAGPVAARGGIVRIAAGAGAGGCHGRGGGRAGALTRPLAPADGQAGISLARSAPPGRFHPAWRAQPAGAGNARDAP